MSSSFRSHKILINSKDNLSSDLSDASFNFSQSDLQQITKVQLKDVGITNLLYNVELGINDRLDYDVAGIPKSILIPPGNYQSSTLGNVLNTLLLADQMVFTFSNTNFKYSVTSVPLTFLKDSSTIKKVIGLSITTLPSNLYELQNTVNFIRTHFIHLLSDLASLDSGFTSNRKMIPIIASIPVNLPFGFILNQTQELDSSDVDIKKNAVNISDLSIRFVDDDYKKINLNGGEYFISFTVLKR